MFCDATEFGVANFSATQIKKLTKLIAAPPGMMADPSSACLGTPCKHNTLYGMQRMAEPRRTGIVKLEPKFILGVGQNARSIDSNIPMA